MNETQSIVGTLGTSWSPYLVLEALRGAPARRTSRARGALEDLDLRLGTGPLKRVLRSELGADER